MYCTKATPKNRAIPKEMGESMTRKSTPAASSTRIPRLLGAPRNARDQPLRKIAPKGKSSDGSSTKLYCPHSTAIASRHSPPPENSRP